jgi:hypothetical protein
MRAGDARDGVREFELRDPAGNLLRVGQNV